MRLISLIALFPLLASAKVYDILINTGCRLGAGTSARILITLTDSNGITFTTPLPHRHGPLELSANGFGDSRDMLSFSACSYRSFQISGPVLHEICSITLAHDGSRAFAPWYVNQVYVKTYEGSVRFPFNRWIGRSSNHNIPAFGMVNQCYRGHPPVVLPPVAVTSGPIGGHPPPYPPQHLPPYPPQFTNPLYGIYPGSFTALGKKSHEEIQEEIVPQGN